MRFKILLPGSNCVKKSDMLKGEDKIPLIKKIDSGAKYSEGGTLLHAAVHQNGILVNCVDLHTGMLSWMHPDEEVVQII